MEGKNRDSRSIEFLIRWIQETLTLDRYSEWNAELVRDMTRMCIAEATAYGIATKEIEEAIGCDLEVMIHQAMANPIPREYRRQDALNSLARH